MAEEAAAAAPPPFGAALRRHRLAAGLSQDALAERAGLSARAISDLERGVSGAPRPATLRLLADALALAPAARAALAGAAPAAAPGVPAPAAGPARAARPAHSLPARRTSFVGREGEVAELRARLGAPGGPRLVTLTGPGGVGKTRLALEAAATLPSAAGGPDPDGVWWVDLAPLADGTLVARAALAAVGGREGPGRPPLAALVDHLRPRAGLLVLDNCEHLVDACAALADALLEGCPGVRLLVTSRAPLGVAGEAVWPVPPLPVPAPPAPGAEGAETPPPAAADLARYAAVRLFAERAAAARPGFAVAAGNAAAVAEVCRRLDGIPLALELAAARVRVLTVAQLAARLDDRFRLLTGGSRTALPRQQTLRATLDWSHALLAAVDQTLLRRLAVFAGGFGLPAAEAVGGGPPLAAGDVLDGLTRLLDQSLVQLEGDAGGDAGGAEARYRLLETVREYARERLAASGEAAALGARHAAHYLALEVGETDRLLRPRVSTGPEPARRARRVREQDNIRVALRWCLEHGAVERALAFAVGPLWTVWMPGGHWVEAQRWLEALLAAGAALPAGLRAAGHFGLGVCAQYTGDYGEAVARFETSLALARQAGEPLAQALGALGRARWLAGDDRGAEAALRESFAGAEATGDGLGVAYTLRDLSVIARDRGDYPQARALLERSVAAARAYFPRYPFHYVRSVARLGQLAALEGRLPEAAARLREALADMAQTETGVIIPDALEWLAPVLSAGGRPAAAARLLGAAAAGRRVTHHRREHREEPAFERDVAAVRARLPAAAFRAAWAAGERMSPEQAVAYALEETPDAATADRDGPAPSPPARRRPGGLTAREAEVLRHVAAGATDRQIAAALGVSEETVGRHLTHIFRKLHVSSRAAAGVFAARHGLA